MAAIPERMEQEISGGPVGTGVAARGCIEHVLAEPIKPLRILPEDAHAIASAA
jgi:hypothetical protein